MKRTILAALAAFTLLAGDAMAVDLIRANMACGDGVLSAMGARTDNEIFNRRGGAALDAFSVDLRRVDDLGQGWNGASWIMCRNRCWIDEDLATLSLGPLAETGAMLLVAESLDALYDEPGPGRIETVSYEAFVEDAVQTFKLNTGQSNVAVVTFIQGSDPGDDFDLSVHPLVAFNAMLADTTKKPWALERVPVDP